MIIPQENLPKKCKFCIYATKKGKYVFCEDKNELMSSKYVCRGFRPMEEIEVEDSVALKFCHKWGIILDDQE